MVSYKWCRKEGVPGTKGLTLRWRTTFRLSVPLKSIILFTLRPCLIQPSRLKRPWVSTCNNLRYEVLDWSTYSNPFSESERLRGRGVHILLLFTMDIVYQQHGQFTVLLTFYRLSTIRKSLTIKIREITVQWRVVWKRRGRLRRHLFSCFTPWRGGRVEGLSFHSFESTDLGGPKVFRNTESS